MSSRLGMLLFFQRIFDVVIWQMKYDVMPEEQPEEEKAAVDEEARKTTAHLSQDTFCLHVLAP